MKIDLTKEQLGNILVFLNRVDLKGSEAGMLIDIVVTLQRAQQAQQIVDASIKKDKTDKDGKK